MAMEQSLAQSSSGFKILLQSLQGKIIIMEERTVITATTTAKNGGS
jgi:hypothetical protein